MTPDPSTPTPIVIPTRKRQSSWVWPLLTTLAVAVGLLAWGSGFRPSQLWASTPAPISMLEVDQGDLALVVTENGSLESAKNATVRCQVEALIGMVGGAQGAVGPNARGGAQGKQGGQGGQGGQAGQGGQTVQQPAPAQAQPKAKAKAGASKAQGAAAAATAATAAKKQSDGPVQEAPVDPSGGGGKGVPVRPGLKSRWSPS